MSNPIDKAIITETTSDHIIGWSELCKYTNTNRNKLKKLMKLYDFPKPVCKFRDRYTLWNVWSKAEVNGYEI